MGIERRSGARRRGAVLLGATTFVVVALAVACTPPPTAPPPPPVPGPPEISSFGAIAERSAAPVVATLGWRISDPDSASLTCRVDVDGDGSVERIIEPCRSIDSVLAQFDTAGTRTATLEVDDGEYPPVTAQTTIAVADGPDETYEITLRRDPAMAPEFAAAFDEAATRWESVITAGVADVALDLPDGLFGWVPGFSGVVDDVLIDARVGPIDGPGGTLGRAGGLAIRQPQWQPYWGVMEFDEADLAALAATGRLEDVIVHEMGHVLGLGPSWLLTGRVSDLFDPAYNGPAGVAAYQELGGNHLVPLENEGAVGTILGHWRESVFGDELMTGFLGSRPAVMSRLTIAALADLGYGVDLSQAEEYSLLTTAAARDHGGHDHDGHDHGGHDHGEVPHSDPIPPFLDGIPGV